jgi:hypothetical protein
VKVFLKGRGVPQDNKDALAWFRKAATQGDINGQMNLGMMCAEGCGMPVDLAQAYFWIAIAGGGGAEGALSSLLAVQSRMTRPQRTAAQRSVGLAYAEGKDVPKDVFRAYVWLLLAAEDGDLTSSQELLRIEKEITPQQASKARELSNALKN